MAFISDSPMSLLRTTQSDNLVGRTSRGLIHVRPAIKDNVAWIFEDLCKERALQQMRMKSERRRPGRAD
jgi:hypothetical protein